MKPTDFSYALTKYLSSYLPGHRNASQNTIFSYRDTFKLLLRFAENECGIRPERLTLATIDMKFVERFLGWLESSGNCSISTRNLRLSAIRAFFRYLQREKPEMLTQCQQMLSIESKSAAKTLVNYLSVDAVRYILAAPDVSDPYGLRDSAALSLLYESGARVSEIASLNVMDIRVSAPAVVTLMGKRRKARQCPLPATVADNLALYLSVCKLDSPDKSAYPLFVNHKKERLSRAGIKYVLKKYADMVREKHPGIMPKTVSPHMLRHSKAMHLLQADVNLIYIRDWLGHTSIKTTGVYAKADTEMKRNAFKKVAPVVSSLHNENSWSDDTGLMQWLDSLGQ